MTLLHYFKENTAASLSIYERISIEILQYLYTNTTVLLYEKTSSSTEEYQQLNENTKFYRIDVKIAAGFPG